MEHEGLGVRINTREKVAHFDPHSAWSEVPASQSCLIGFVNAGDHLGICTDIDNLEDFANISYSVSCESHPEDARLASPGVGVAAVFGHTAGPLRYPGNIG